MNLGLVFVALIVVAIIVGIYKIKNEKFEDETPSVDLLNTNNEIKPENTQTSAKLVFNSESIINSPSVDVVSTKAKTKKTVSTTKSITPTTKAKAKKSTTKAKK